MSDFKTLLNDNTCPSLKAASVGNAFAYKRVVTSYTELVAAINELTTGGVIELMPGTYDGNITLTTNMTIYGHGYGITTLTGTITVTGAVGTTEVISLKDFAITADTDAEALTITACNKVIIEGMKITGDRDGAELIDSDDGVFEARNCIITNAGGSTELSIVLANDGVAATPNVIQDCVIRGGITTAAIVTLIDGVDLLDGSVTESAALYIASATGLYA